MLLVGTAFAAIVTGCGSSSQRIYSLPKTTACLKTQPVRLGGQLDFVASTATGGAVKIHTKDNFLTLVFGKTVSDADNIAAAYRRLRMAGFTAANSIRVLKHFAAEPELLDSLEDAEG